MPRPHLCPVMISPRLAMALRRKPILVRARGTSAERFGFAGVCVGDARPVNGAERAGYKSAGVNNQPGLHAIKRTRRLNHGEFAMISTQRPTIPQSREVARWRIAMYLNEFLANGGQVRRFANGDTNVIWTLNENFESVPLYRTPLI